jgi:hypothetical protein
MIPPFGLISRLQGDGISTRWLQDQTGESRLACITLLKSLGATQSDSMWRLPSRERRMLQEGKLSGNHSGTRRDGDLPWAKT